MKAQRCLDEMQRVTQLFIDKMWEEGVPAAIIKDYFLCFNTDLAEFTQGVCAKAAAWHVQNAGRGKPQLNKILVKEIT